MIVPAPIDIGMVKAAIDGSLEFGAQIVKKDMEDATATWRADTKPNWTKDGPRSEGADRVLEYWTSDTPFVYVNEGTKGPYLIPKTPKPPGQGLGPFQPDFIPKTQPRTLASGPGGSFGPFVFPKQVTHPGIKPREFTDISAMRLDVRMFQIMQLKLDGVRSL